MKNAHQVKQEEEIGNLPEKEFRIIIKMIQNLENKMELQINSLETKIEKMQEMFNKDLEEIKKSQLKINNAINEIKNTLEGTKSRITETEDRISEVEDKMVEINEAERKKESKEMRTISGTSGTTCNAPTFECCRSGGCHGNCTITQRACSADQCLRGPATPVRPGPRAPAAAGRLKFPAIWGKEGGPRRKEKGGWLGEKKSKTKTHTHEKPGEGE